MPPGPRARLSPSTLTCPGDIRMRPLAIAMLLTLAGTATLTAHAQPLRSVEAVVGFIDAATSHVLLVSPTLYSRPVADAIRRAAVERGVTVQILVEASHVEDPAAYVAGLSRLARVEVRVVQRIQDAALLSDGRYLLRGPLVWKVPAPAEAPDTELADLQDGSPELVTLRRWLRQVAKAWAQATRYVYQPGKHLPKP